MRGQVRSSWPTGDQRLLLRAATLPRPEAAAAWRAWRSRVDRHRLDEGSVRLLPLLSQNLARHGIADPLLDQLRSAQRHTWARNMLVLQSLGELLGALDQAGVPTSP